MRKIKSFSLDDKVLDAITRKCPADVPESRFIEKLLKEVLHIK